MPYKILCLHGVGTSSAIWEAQLTGIRCNLPDDWEWIFVDGEEESLPAEGIAAIYNGPYLRYYTLPTLEVIQDCHALLDEVIEEQGPFDAVLAFSQGGALAASYLLHKQKENPWQRPPFSIAVFICANLPYSRTPDCGADILSVCKSLGSQPDAWKTVVLSGDVQLESAIRACSEAADGDMAEQVRPWHPDVDKTRISIPTVHVYGAQDPYLPQGQLLEALCESSLTFICRHTGGHEIPRAPAFSKEVADAILKAKAKAELVH